MPAPKPPEVVEAALLAVADGASAREAARIAGVSKSVVSSWTRKLEAHLDELRARIRARWARNVLADADAISRAQVAAASDATCRHGPQAARVLLEGAGIIGGPRDVTVNGDITVDASVAVDARRQVILSDADAARYRELRERVAGR